MAFFECWNKARSGNLLPTKESFEGAILNAPELIPNMSFAELGPGNQLQFKLIGSDIVQRRGEDQTGLGVESMFAPKAGELLTMWAMAMLETPHLNFYEAQTRLPRGVIAESSNLAAVLTDGADNPTFIAVATIVGDAYGDELEVGGYLIGSIRFSVNPIDIGFGIPDLPRIVAR